MTSNDNQKSSRLNSEKLTSTTKKESNVLCEKIKTKSAAAGP